VTKKPF